METIGKIHLINEVKKVTEKFSIQEFVLDTEEKYPQKIKFSLMNDKISLLTGFQIGDKIKVAFNLTGKEYNGNYFNTLSAWKIQPLNPESKSKSYHEEDEVPF